MANPPQPTVEAPSPDSRAPFTAASVLARAGRRLELDEDSRVLEFRVQGPSAAVLLAQATGCRITVADVSKEVLERVQLEADAAGVLHRLTLLTLVGEPPALPAEAFDVALSASRAAQLAEVATQLRPVLVPSKGRLLAVVAVRVGLARRDLAAWEKAFGAPLRPAQTELLEMTKHGFEPEWMETLSEAEVVQRYAAAAAHPGEAAALAQLGPAGLSFALVAGRRREPNEAPPPARDRG